MKRKDKLPELLSPAGSPAAMYAAVEAGADAVYLGGRAFGARAYAKNFDAAEMAAAVTYCHLHGVKVYVTVNTLIYDREMDAAVAYGRELSAMGADAVIATDPGLMMRLRAEVPDLPVHISTQFGVHSTGGVFAGADLGATRAVLARELSLSDIRRAVEESPLEIEVFLHGALCVCHSGQCLFSSLVGGRSGNRGECAQPCRLPYGGKDRYPLSLRDLCLVRHLRELCDAGVASLKIEGRMKSPDYVYGVTKIYRRLLDEGRDGTEEDVRALAAIFSRGGFTDGYLTGNIRAPMTGVRSEEDKAQTREGGSREFLPRLTPVCAGATFRLGEPASLTLRGEGKSVTVCGDVPVPAQNAPLNTQDLTTRLCKMGGTFLSLSPSDVSIQLDEGINLPPAAINALRRAAVSAFCATGRDCPTFPPRPRPAAVRQTPWRTALFLDPALYAACGNPDGFFSLIFLPLPEHPGAAGEVCGVYLPPVIPDGEADGVRAMLHRARLSGVTHALVGNPGHLAMVKEEGLIPVGDFRLNISNACTSAYYRSLGVERQILSPELTLPMIRDIGGGTVVYGRIPLMLTERCFVRENGGCSRCGHFAFTDRRGTRFPVLREYPHRNLILNSLPTYMGDRRAELSAAGVGQEHFLFTVETPEEVAAVVRAYRAGKPLSGQVRRIGR